MKNPDPAKILKSVQDLVAVFEEKGYHTKMDAYTKIMDLQTETIATISTCLVSIKKDLAVVMTEQKNYIQTRRDRSDNCDKIHADHEQRLRKSVPLTRCETNEITIDKIDQAITKLSSFKNKIIGACLVISIVVPTFIGVIIAFVLKKYIGG